MRRPFTIGITGGSGSGKTHFIEALSSHFDPRELCLISQDHYYKPIDQQSIDAQGVTNFDLPESIEHEQFRADVIRIKAGEKVIRPAYNFNNPRIPARLVEFLPAPILIVEGLFVQYFADVEKELDLKIFIEAEDHIKLTRRIRRDNTDRGYDLDDVLYRYEHHVMPVYEQIIKPLRQNADIIIPNNRHFEGALRILVAALKNQL